MIHLLNAHDISIQIYKRDGRLCPLTGMSFDPEDGIKPHLAHIIPISVRNKVGATILPWLSLILLQPDAIKCIAMLAGTAVCDLVLEQLNGLGNLMNIGSDARAAHNDIRWGIEASDTNGVVGFSSSMCLSITHQS